MSTGDPFCHKCHRWFCYGECDFAQLSVTTKVFERIEVTARQLGQIMSSGEMQEQLAGYLGDEFFAQKFMECIDLIKVKNADYSQGEQKGDRIAAFRRIARDINITMEQAWAVFCQKHWGAVMKYVKEGSVESEPIDTRITDIINYMVLLAAIVDDGRKVGHGG